MAIVIVTNGNFFACIILRRLIQERRALVKGVVVVDGDYYGNARLRAFLAVARRTTLPYLVFKVWMILALKALQAIRPTRVLSVEKLARAHGIPVLREINVNSDRCQQFLQGFQPQLLVSVSCPQRIHQRILRVASRAAINIHSSLLPRYGGLAPYYWVLAEDEHDTGVTVHYMTERIDDGRIILQQKHLVPANVSAFELFHQLAVMGGKLLLEATDMALKGIEGTEQPADHASYRSHPDLRSYLKLRANGFRLMRVRDLRHALGRT